ncbi:uncharacterized protein LOC120990517 isoform X2 [Bufo bufo]|uniref:uncharacterized protein LOC120990517 isoform X2 n=1 Tax=Bufo bufo TaxID=8384 RepID=UPI001ABDDC06|nr:uncharacterized protein LOC120990517 isoform X2 [Bufo bufo]
MLLKLFLLIGMINVITSGDVIDVTGRLGTNLLFQVADACRTNSRSPFDIYSEKRKIGTYHEELKGLRSYNGRLKYNKTTCTVTLTDLTEADGSKFQVHFQFGIDGKSGPHYINYTVIMKTGDSTTTDPPLTTLSEPTNRNKSQVSTRRLLGFVSFCFSLDSVVHAMFTFVLLILTLKRFCERLEEQSANFAFGIICGFMVLSQVVSLGLISSERSYSWFLVLIPIILVMDILLYFGCLPKCVGAQITNFMDRFCNSRCKQIAQYIWRGFILLLQVGFTVCVGHIYHGIDDDNSRGQSPNNGYVAIAFIISFLLNLGIFFIGYCYKTKRNGYTQAPPKEVGTAPDNPGKTCEASV